MNPNSRGTKHTVIEGQTENLDIKLLEDGAEKDYSGISIGIEFSALAALTALEIAAVTVVWQTQTTGIARVSGLDALPVGKHGFRFTLTSGGDTGYSPNGDERDFFQVVGV